MESLLWELKKNIVAILPMPDKRNLIRCNKEFNKIEIKKYEEEFIEMIYNTKFFVYTRMTSRRLRLTKIEQYTLEMIYYGYHQLIPARYICNKNELLYKYNDLYFYCASKKYIEILKILFKFKSEI